MGNFESFGATDTGSAQATAFNESMFNEGYPQLAKPGGTDTTGGARTAVEPERSFEVKPTDRVDESGRRGSDSRPSNLSSEHPSPFVMAAAFQALKDNVGVDLTKPDAWLVDPNNPEQAYFADRLPKAVDLLPGLPSGVEVKGMASTETPDPVNDFLREQGFDIQLRQSDDPYGLYLAGTLKVNDDWSARAKKMEGNDGKVYDSVYKSGHVLDINGRQIAEIHSNEDKGIKVYAIPMPEDLPGYKVNELAEDFIKQAHAMGPLNPEDRKRIEFPMVDMNSQAEIDGLKGMIVNGTDLYIEQAKMQTIVQMDETGFLAKQAAAVGIAIKSLAPKDPPADFQVKDKFIFAVADMNGNLIFASHIGQQNWNRPNEVAKK